MNNSWLLRIALILIIVLVLAGCNTDNNTADINSSYDAIKTAHINDPSNGEISFIYDAINNQISGYPKTVPNFINLPFDSIMDAIGTDERVFIQYVNDDNYQNGIIIEQVPQAGAAWDDGVVVNLIVNRKYSSVNSKNGSMGLLSDKLYLLSDYYYIDNNQIGTIWTDGENLIEGEITKLYADNGNVYYDDNSGIYRLNGESILQVLEKKTAQYVVHNEKIYYRDIEKDGDIYCYNMNDKTNTFVHDKNVLFIYVTSDFIVLHSPHDIFILDNENYKIVKNIHSENTIFNSSVDNDSIYYAELIFHGNSILDQNQTITKYNIKQDAEITVFDSNDIFGDIFAIDDKIIFQHYLNNQVEFRYIDTRNMQNKSFIIENDHRLDSIGDIIDILFDGQRIIYEKRDRTFYSICIFTGETKQIELN